MQAPVLRLVEVRGMDRIRLFSQSLTQLVGQRPSKASPSGFRSAQGRGRNLRL